MDEQQPVTAESSSDSGPLEDRSAIQATRDSILVRGVKLLAAMAPLCLVFLFIGIYDAVWEPDREFFTSYRFSLIAKHTAIVGMGALGMTVIIISGGIDLSVGSMLAMLSVLLADILSNQSLGLELFGRQWFAIPMQPWAAAICVLAAGAVAGGLNGVLIARVRLVPFLATLGTMMVYRGTAGWISEQKKISVPDAPRWLAGLLDTPPVGSWQGVCWGVYLVLLLAAAVAFLLKMTIFGRYVYAIGSNEQAARLCGIEVDRLKIAIYALGGVFVAIAAAFSFSDLNSQGDPTAGLALELDIIAAVVIGGGSLSGGRGSVFGSLIGAVTMTTLRNGCVFAQIDESVQSIVIGSIVIVAVAVDQAIHRGKSG